LFQLLVFSFSSSINIAFCSEDDISGAIEKGNHHLTTICITSKFACIINRIRVDQTRFKNSIDRTSKITMNEVVNLITKTTLQTNAYRFLSICTDKQAHIVFCLGLVVILRQKLKDQTPGTERYQINKCKNVNTDFKTKSKSVSFIPNLSDVQRISKIKVRLLKLAAINQTNL